MRPEKYKTMDKIVIALFAIVMFTVGLACITETTKPKVIAHRFSLNVKLNTSQIIDLIYEFCKEKLEGSYFATLEKVCLTKSGCMREIVCHARRGDWTAHKSFSLKEFEEWLGK